MFREVLMAMIELRIAVCVCALISGVNCLPTETPTSIPGDPTGTTATTGALDETPTDSSTVFETTVGGSPQNEEGSDADDADTRFFIHLQPCPPGSLVFISCRTYSTCMTTGFPGEKRSCPIGNRVVAVPMGNNMVGPSCVQDFSCWL